jgi:hypothetical protein
MKRHAKETKRKAKVISSTKGKKATSKTKPKTLKSSQKKSGKTTKKTVKNKESRFEDVLDSLSSISEINH